MSQIGLELAQLFARGYGTGQSRRLDVERQKFLDRRSADENYQSERDFGLRRDTEDRRAGQVGRELDLRERDVSRLEESAARVLEDQETERAADAILAEWIAMPDLDGPAFDGSGPTLGSGKYPIPPAVANAIGHASGPVATKALGVIASDVETRQTRSRAKNDAGAMRRQIATLDHEIAAYESQLEDASDKEPIAREIIMPRLEALRGRRNALELGLYGAEYNLPTTAAVAKMMEGQTAKKENLADLQRSIVAEYRAKKADLLTARKVVDTGMRSFGAFDTPDQTREIPGLGLMTKQQAAAALAAIDEQIGNIDADRDGMVAQLRGGTGEREQPKKAEAPADPEFDAKRAFAAEYGKKHPGATVEEVKAAYEKSKKKR